MLRSWTCQGIQRAIEKVVTLMFAHRTTGSIQGASMNTWTGATLLPSAVPVSSVHPTGLGTQTSPCALLRNTLSRVALSCVATSLAHMLIGIPYEKWEYCWCQAESNMHN